MRYSCKQLLASIAALALGGCSGKYLVKTYPSGAKVYTRNLNSNEKKLVGLSPTQIKEESGLGDVFFLVFEKQNYREKEVMIRVNDGESLTVSAQLDPLTPAEIKETETANNQKENKEDPKQQGGQPPKKPEDEMEALKQEIADLNLRISLLENTSSFYKDAIFSSRFSGGPSRYDRDKADDAIKLMFQAQQAIAANRLDQAVRYVDKAIEQDEYATQAWLLKGSISFLKKDLNGAKLAWERSLKIDPYNRIALKYLNETYKKLNQPLLQEPPLELRTPANVLEIDRRKSRAK